MRTIEQLRMDFTLYFNEIERCETAKCYWALLHVLLALPDICTSMETDPKILKKGVGDRYVEWCSAYLPKNPVISAADRYQMRNALLHSGSTTAQNLYKKHHTCYTHFSFLDPETFDITVHCTTNQSRNILNVHASAMAAETKEAIENWFKSLQHDYDRMSLVEQNIGRLSRLQPKRILVSQPNGDEMVKTGWTQSST